MCHITGRSKCSDEKDLEDDDGAIEDDDEDAADADDL